MDINSSHKLLEVLTLAGVTGPDRRAVVGIGDVGTRIEVQGGVGVRAGERGGTAIVAVVDVYSWLLESKG